MMGVAIYSLDDPILKTTNAIVALNERDSRPPKASPCIHCGRCVAACPMGLNPTAFSKAMGISDVALKAERLNENKINLCIECGCCSFVCPAKRPLVENNRLAKADLRQIMSSGLVEKK
jgi:electron transport complex protein RnfC